jgi:hypothetical protein
MGDAKHGQARVVGQTLVIIFGIFKGLFMAKLKILGVSLRHNLRCFVQHRQNKI